MKYTKPQITNTANASSAIMAGQKLSIPVGDNSGFETNGAYSADE